MVAVGNPPTLKPSSIRHYNANMGGVDLADQLRSYYKVGRPSKKWWRYVFWFLVDVTMVNAWIIYSASTHVPPARRGYDQLHFRSDVAELLRAGFTSRKHVKGRRSSTVVAAVDAVNVGGHHPVRIQMKRGRAVCPPCVGSVLGQVEKTLQDTRSRPATDVSPVMLHCAKLAALRNFIRESKPSK